MTAPAPEPARLLFVDAFSGVSGDMLVGALLDVGVDLEVVQGALAALALDGYRIEVGRAERSGIMATRFIVHVEAEQPTRHWSDIRALLTDAALEPACRDIAMAAFERLAQAESTVHGVPPDKVHFHEVGAVDSIVDMVAAAAAIGELGARIICSPLPMGRGFIHAAHGPLPLPVPATVSCLAGIPTVDGGASTELVTPTGAALIATIAQDFAPWPSMRPSRVGWGAGTRELPDRPNLLRVVLGEAAPESTAADADAPFVVMEANVDDMTGEVTAHAVARLLDAGALDAWTMPIGMKKGRPGVLVSALARRADADSLARTLLSETTSLGVRMRPCTRVERPRRMVEVTTIYGQLPVKVADGDGLPTHTAPEFEACRAAAEAHGVPVRQVMEAAVSAAQREVPNSKRPSGSRS